MLLLGAALALPLLADMLQGSRRLRRLGQAHEGGRCVARAASGRRLLRLVCRWHIHLRLRWCCLLRWARQAVQLGRRGARWQGRRSSASIRRLPYPFFCLLQLGRSNLLLRRQQGGAQPLLRRHLLLRSICTGRPSTLALWCHCSWLLCCGGRPMLPLGLRLCRQRRWRLLRAWVPRHSCRHGRRSLLCRSRPLCLLPPRLLLLALLLLPAACCFRLALLRRGHARSVGRQPGGVCPLVHLCQNQARLSLMPQCRPVLVLHMLHGALPPAPSRTAAGNRGCRGCCGSQACRPGRGSCHAHRRQHCCRCLCRCGSSRGALRCLWCGCHSRGCRRAGIDLRRPRLGASRRSVLALGHHVHLQSTTGQQLGRCKSQPG